MSTLGLICTMLTPENMALKSAAEASGASLKIIRDEQQAYLLAGDSIFNGLNVALARSSSFTRSVYLSKLAEEAGVPVINTSHAQSLCGDKALTSAFLMKKGISTPKVLLAFSPASALQAIESIGYPAIIKPPVGSWGRMVCKVNDRHAAEAVVSLKDSLGHYTDKVYYVQEYVDKPQRDIRVFVVGDEVAFSIYRKISESSSTSFITNLNHGGTAEPFELTPEMKELVSKTVSALGAGIYGIDLIEYPDGRLGVLEVNHAPEFSKSAGPNTPRVAEKIVQFALAQARQ
ncbi:Alpha-aminoadipate--LysW ligase LysX [uncultured archaeon]|nr:Alpha-aminoadipate--LysW ligase LysX [uncultured archaeon]